MANSNDVLAAYRAQEAQRRTDEVNATLALTPNGAPAETVLQPSESNDQWLANSINELKAKDAEYARLTTEQSRREWEEVTRSNLARQRRQSELITARSEAARASTQQRDDIRDAGLVQHAAALNAILPDKFSEWTLPLDQLRDVAKTAQELDMVQQRRKIGPYGDQPQQPAIEQPQATTFPDGSPYKVTQLPDGQLTVELANGQTYTGNALDVTQKIAGAFADFTRAGQTQRPQANSEQSFSSDFGTWAADEQARALGFSDHNEMIQWGQRLDNSVEKMENMLTATEFLSQHPEYPNSEQANEALSHVVDKFFNGNWNPETMGAAHAYAVQYKLYTPLTQEQINATWADEMSPKPNRQTPPPMIRGNNPETAYSSNNDPYSMPLADLRKAAIRQELEGQGRR
jgi:hypothetical protein